MAQVSIVRKATVFAVAAVAISAVAVSAQDVAAPAPSPDAGAAFSVASTGIMIGTSLLLSKQCEEMESEPMDLIGYDSIPIKQMAVARKISMVAVVAVALSAAATAVSAQGPAPSPDAGAAFSVPASGIMIGTSLIKRSSEMARFNKASMIGVVAVALTAVSSVAAQGPAPSPDAGAAFALPASVSENIVPVGYHKKFKQQLRIQTWCSLPRCFVRVAIRRSREMARFNKASMIGVVAVALMAASTVAAQGPAPSPDVGAAFSVPASGVMIATSLLISFVALLKN
ncbi:hypothetical protein OSB04_023473 [Centaurea solstitialis]|uniref:Uncharacterized protein n=1 Tax=Centaurea solstitialis TaxID=347529 RepID=A0AA38SXL9_9ASTR|nr:hypothetical protein OSB04_023473 [Centaurea solstitialis]